MMIMLPTMRAILGPNRPMLMQNPSVKFTAVDLGSLNRTRLEAGHEHLPQQPNEAMASVFDLFGRPEMPMYQHEVDLL